jgi:hypothetical protein
MTPRSRGRPQAEPAPLRCLSRRRRSRRCGVAVYIVPTQPGPMRPRLALPVAHLRNEKSASPRRRETLKLPVRMKNCLVRDRRSRDDAIRAPAPPAVRAGQRCGLERLRVLTKACGMAVRATTTSVTQIHLPAGAITSPPPRSRQTLLRTRRWCIDRAHVVVRRRARDSRLPAVIEMPRAAVHRLPPCSLRIVRGHQPGLARFAGRIASRDHIGVRGTVLPGPG